MIRLLKSSISPKLALAVLLALGLWTSAFAGGPTQSSGLGQSWPNVADISSSSHWHVYAFERDGIRYIQVNDLNGTVRAALATANGELLVLPIGTDADHVSTPQQSTKGEAGAKAQGISTETIYRDSSIQLSVVLQLNGRILLLVTAADCGTPTECGTHSN